MKKINSSNTTIINLINDCVIIIDLHGIIKYINAKAKSLLGLSDQKLAGKNLLKMINLIEEQTFNLVEFPLKRIVSENIDLISEKYLLIRSDKNDIPLEGDIIRIQNKEGITEEICFIFRDISKQKYIEKLLKEAELQITEYVKLLDIIPNAIFVQNLEDRIILWNEGATQLYGWPTTQVLGRKSTDFLFKNDKLFFNKLKKMLSNEGKWQGELELINKNGRDLLVLLQCIMLNNYKTTTKSILFVGTDISKHKLISDQLLRTQRLESVGILAGGIVHDLNNVFSPILLAINLLSQKLKDKNSKKWLEMVKSNCERGTDIVRQVLTFSRGIEGENVELQLRHFIKEMAKITKETFPKNIEIQTNIAEELWCVQGDITKLHQLLMNLCVNAREAMINGGLLKISAYNTCIDENYAHTNPEIKAGSYIVLEVSDTGVGITHENLNKIFEPFYTTKESGKGTGLGLSVVKKIVSRHKGFITIESDPGKKTVCKVYLPAIKTKKYIKVTEGKDIQLPSGNGELILFVDDEQAIQQITKKTLELNGYRVMLANDGVEAVALYAENKNKIDLVFTDMVMPHMNGSATIRAVLKINPGAKIIATSGMISEEKICDVDKSLIKAFIWKPFTTEKLLTTIHQVIKN